MVFFDNTLGFAAFLLALRRLVFGLRFWSDLVGSSELFFSGFARHVERHSRGGWVHGCQRVGCICA